MKHHHVIDCCGTDMLLDSSKDVFCDYIHFRAKSFGLNQQEPESVSECFVSGKGKVRPKTSH